MKVEDSKPFWYNVSATKQIPPRKGVESSCRQYTIFRVRNATTNIHFIVTARILTVIRSIFAETANISLPPTDRAQRGRERGKLSAAIRRVRCAANQASFIMTMNTTPIIAVAIRIVITRSSSGSPLPYQLRQCRSSSASITSSE